MVPGLKSGFEIGTFQIGNNRPLGRVQNMKCRGNIQGDSRGKIRFFFGGGVIFSVVMRSVSYEHVSNSE